MTLTNAEKQRRYRKRHLGASGGKVRLQLFINADLHDRLKALASERGYSLTEQVEALIILEEEWRADEYGED